MSKPTIPGHGIQVVTADEEHRFHLDEEALRRLLLADDVRDRAVVLVSVAGAFRKGKSFMLDFFLRYLDYTYVRGEGGSGDGAGGEWLGAEDQALQGFPWRGGSERHTTGIHLWSQPFKATLPNGEKVVILLMDTQGTFDSESTVKDNATVFALSTMLSSVLIYNVSQNIDEDDLQHLQLFIDYGRVALDKISGKPFQRLQFLVRDWSYPDDHPYGAAGGEALLNKRLKMKEGQHEELQKLRAQVRACFEQLACFLLPHPGLRVATSQDYNGKLADISPEFKAGLRELVPMLLAPQNLVPKVMDGRKMKARDLLNYFTSYMEVFNSDELPKPTSILQATAEANNRSAMADARDEYDTLMGEVCGGARPYLPPPRLRAEHRRARDKVLHAFHAKKKMGGRELAEKYRDELVADLEKQFEQLAAHNEGKNIYRIVGTPLVFAALMILGYLLAAVGHALGLQTLVAVGQAVSMASLAVLTVWGYTRLTGNMREVGIQLDEVANTLRSYVTRQVVYSGSHETESAAMGSSEDSRKDS